MNYKYHNYILSKYSTTFQMKTQVDKIWFDLFDISQVDINCDQFIKLS